MSSRAEGGYSLVELLAAMGLFGLLLGAVAPLGLQVMRETEAATERARVLETRWETVRRIRLDASRATELRTLRDWQGEERLLELRLGGARVTWAAHEGSLQRLAEIGPVVQELEIDVRFRAETREGRRYLAYVLEDSAGRVTGRVHLGSLR